ncbi:MAG: 50S ribosomal protein L35 [Pseudomonadota bacterium]
MAKQKLKSKRGAMKRFKVTGSGKIRFRRQNRGHGIVKKKTTKEVRQNRRHGVLADCDTPGIKYLLLAVGS